MRRSDIVERIAVGIDGVEHGPELDQPERLAVEPRPDLAEEDRPAERHRHRQRDRRHHRREHDQAERGEEDVGQASWDRNAP